VAPAAAAAATRTSTFEGPAPSVGIPDDRPKGRLVGGSLRVEAALRRVRTGVAQALDVEQDVAAS
jgi:hypothetical protein